MDRQALLGRARDRGVNPIAYWLVRGILQPFFHVYFRLSRIGREHIPAEGPVILASNHRSFLDPFVIAVMARRPIYFVAKQELFVNRPIAWLLGALGAFPIDRHGGDEGAMATARAILERGHGVLIFPEGTRIRPGALGRPKRGVGRLALESGAPVVPIAVFGSEAVRNGWRFRPHKVRIRAGAPLTFPKVESPSPALAGAVTDRIWPCVELQWEWLGGTPSIRRAAIIGHGPPATRIAQALARAGFETEQGAIGDLSHHDLVCFAMPARNLPEALDRHGARIPERAAVVVLSRGLVPPLGTLPTAFVAERTAARAVACVAGPGADILAAGATIVTASTDGAFLTQLAGVLRIAGLEVQATTDVTGVELAAAASDAAALAGATGGPGAADMVFAEVDALARRHGGRPETFAGLAGRTPDHHDADAIEALPLLAAALQHDGIDAPAVSGLADVVAGRVEPERWAAAVMQPTSFRRNRAA
ncbi:MAG: glycerol-3-phosphate dehydrogenase [Solirubrobacteraceae bacterium]